MFRVCPFPSPQRLTPSLPRLLPATVVLVAGLLAGTGSAEAQQSTGWDCPEAWEQPGPLPGRAGMAWECPDVSPDTVPAAPGSADSDSIRGTSLTATRQPKLIRALGGLAFANLAAVGINNLARNLESTSPSSWARNIQGGWNWDANNISTNNIEHPYGGAIYYNIGRINGFSFWGSAPITMAGSLMWELFGEPTAPAKNDLITTTLGGISLGETVLRLSDLVLDNQAYGLNRFWREAAVTIMNPVVGLNRIAKGEAWQHGPNPSGRRPDSYQTLLTMGGRRLSFPEGSPYGAPYQAFAGFELQYGNPFTETKTVPFSNFLFTSELSTGSITMTEIGTRGMLTSFGRHAGQVDRVSGIFMDLQFNWNEVYIFGVQSFGLGTLSRTGGSNSWRVTTDLSAELAPLVANGDPYGLTVDRREYDYGAGLGARALTHLEYRGTRVATASYQGYLTTTLNGVSTGKLTQFFNLEGRVPMAMGLSAGAAWSLYWQRSSYDTRPTEVQSSPSFSIFVSTGK